MASPAELQKLIANMKRGTALVDRAVGTIEKDAATMDSFEQRLAVKDGFMSQVADFEKQMAAMDAIGNGGPALEATFPSTAPGPLPVAAPPNTVIVASAGTGGIIPSIHRDTGDPVK